MTTSASIGDLSRSAQLRQSSSFLKSRLDVLSSEAASGLKSDVAAALDGQMDRIAHVQARLTALAAFQQNAASAAVELSSMQDAMAAMQAIAQDSGPALLAAAGQGSPTDMDVRAAQAAGDLRSAVRLLNVEVGGRFLMAGAAIQTRPVADADRIMSDVRVAVAGLSTTADIVAAVDGWFDTAPGGGGFADIHYQGTVAGRGSVPVAPGTLLATGRTALDPAFGGLLKGLVLAALAADPPAGGGAADKAQLLTAAGQRIAAAGDRLISAQAEVGRTQEAAEKASVRNAAEITTLSLARSDMLAADPYETATALTQTEASLQTLYALTARLSRLTLTDYLR
ncbi:MAG TPA: flagellin [Paracoccus sp. (in: a-proteobacteria)]|nr:flagellin [Paracoccus sp. (in: a-proteobacteria)]